MPVMDGWKHNEMKESMMKTERKHNESKSKLNTEITKNINNATNTTNTQ